MLVDSALDRITGLRDDNGNTKRRGSKLGTPALVAHQENGDPCCLGFQVPCCFDQAAVVFVPTRSGNNKPKPKQ